MGRSCPGINGVKIMEIKINLPEAVSFKTQGAEFTFEWAKVDEAKLAEFVAACAVAGISKAGVDAAASAAGYAEEHGLDKAAAAKELVGKRFAIWEKGEWTSRGTGSGRSELEERMIAVMRKQVKEGDEAKYKNASPKDRTEMVWAYIEGLTPEQRATLEKHAKELIRIDERAAEARAKLNLGIEL